VKKKISCKLDTKEKRFATWSILLLTCVLTVFYFITPSTVFGQACALQSLSPLSATLTVGETHQLKATVYCRESSPEGIEIYFEITGPNSASSGYATTDGNGEADFNYKGNQDGKDTIIAIIYDSPLSTAATAIWKEKSADIKIETGPAKLNVNSQGVLPMIVYGSEDFDVQTIDPSSLLLNGAVPPQRHAYEDAGSKSSVDPDGFLDLSLKFDIQEIVKVLEAQGVTVNDGQPVTLVLTGSLHDTETAIQTARTATTIRAEQKMVIMNKGKEKKGK
jgi:hypothetical protein